MINVKKKKTIRVSAAPQLFGKALTWHARLKVPEILWVHLTYPFGKGDLGEPSVYHIQDEQSDLLLLV